MRDLFAGLSDVIDFDAGAREKYESQVASRAKVLDIGGRNQHSSSRKRLRALSTNPDSVVVSTDIFDDYNPDIVDDICNTSIPPESFDAVYCNAILEHVEEYWKAIENIHKILKVGGEAFFYVPFFFPYHDRTDFHRFTFTEMKRMLSAFDVVKIIVPGKDSGFGSVLCHVLTFARISSFPKIFSALSRLVNIVLYGVLFLAHAIGRPKIPRKDFIFYYTYLYMNHGFCAYVKK